jgi:hypothetical protein
MSRADLNGFWVWYQFRGQEDANEWTFNETNGNLPSERLLDVARIPSTLFTALSIVVVFAAAFVLSGSRPAAWIAAVLYATTPAVLVNGRRAMQEGGMLLFSSLTVVCAWYAVKEFLSAVPRWRRISLAYGLLGLTGGLAVAAKHTSVLVLGAMYLALFALLWKPGRELESRARWFLRLHLLAGLLGSGLLSMAVFYLLNPVWWAYAGQWVILLCLSGLFFIAAFPVSGRWIWGARALSVAALAAATLIFPSGWTGIYQPIRFIVAARNELMRQYEGYGGALTTPASRLRELGDQLLTAQTQYYESYFWNFLGDEQSEIRTYEAAGLNGRGGGTVWGIFIFVLAAAGAIAVVFRRRRWETWIFLFWLVLSVGAILATNLIPWQRYYLILIPPWSVLGGFAAVLPIPPGWREWIRRRC